MRRILTVRRLATFALTTVLALLAGCVPHPAPVAVAPESPLPVATSIPVDESGLAIAQAGNDFGFALFEQLHEGGQTDGEATNVFISPLSIYLALALTYNGASGETAAEMAQVLGLEGMALEAVNAGSLSLQQSLLNAPGVELLIANSTWVQEGLQLQGEFAATAAEYYDAEAAEVDFMGDPDMAAARVNQWVDEQTKGLIDQMLTPAEARALVLALLNAIYFKGDWAEQFDPERTQDQPFYLADGSEQTMPIMFQTESFPFYAGDTYDALALPYVGERVRMVVVLPHENVGLATLLAEFGPEQWQTTLDGLREQYLAVGLPRFQMEYEQTLNDFLIALGMPRAFSGAAEFDKLVQDAGLSIGFVRHKAVVKVNEEGTEAAAATIVAMPASAPPSFIIDRPFFFAIQDSDSGMVLFMGAVYAPEPLEAQ